MKLRFIQTRASFALLIPLVLFSVFAVVDADCECGFAINDTNDYFTHVIYNNFSSFSPSRTLRSNPDFTRDWVVQKWGIQPQNWATPLAIDNQEDNVFLQGGNLVLRQEGYSKEHILHGSNVSVASIASQNGDIIHGSFRVELKMENATGGSCGGFFWYHNDENEIDIEILAREFKSDSVIVHYTTHPALDENGHLVKNATEVVPLRGDNPAATFQQHRFDWTPTELRFYQNSTQVHSNALRVPNVPGHVYMNLWADGGPWSGSPSTTDVYMSVRTVAIYHNTSASERGVDRTFNLRCEKAGGPSNLTICLDTSIESGRKDPSSIASTVVPLQVWILSLLCVAFGIVVSAI
ncbi:hypothetical protein FQN55_006442 [Onygenales sp. PD_40]|nr:hypothetical protein FQN55_006442 [Onygenales sp. PD_40]KAK2775730.1 hypothetical protein FQN53_003082 [Emmonsiellopsis sp. PD_33]KAK2786239.1 hypothetical protein FQN51_003631 [Onygenales sp. PD_10]